MKLILTALSWLALIVGLLMLTLPIAVLSSAFSKEWNMLSIAIMLPALAMSIGLILVSIAFLRKKGKKEANSIATLTGFMTWISINAMTIDFADSAEEKFGALAIFGVLLLPIFLGMMTTRVMKAFIRKTYEPSSEPVGI